MSAGTTIALAAAQFQRQDLHAAAATCRSILAREPDNGDAMHLLGLVARRLGDLGEAEILLRRSIELRPRNTEYRINLSNLYVAVGRLQDAELTLRSAIAAEPHSRAACLALARVLNHGRAYVAAEALGRGLLEHDRDDAEAWAALGDSVREQGRMEEAANCFEEALRRRPDYAVAKHNLGAVLARLRRAEEALHHLDAAAGLGVRGPHIDTNRASALTELGRLDEAEALLAATVAAAPTFVDAQERLAKLRFVSGDADWLRDLESAVAASADVRLEFLLGDLLRRAGARERALEVLTEISRRRRDDPTIDSSLAVVLQECGQLDSALQLAEKAHALRPGDAVIAENYVAIALQCERPDDARRIAATHRERAPHDQRWITYEATAAAHVDPDRHRWLFDYERFIGVYDIETFGGEGAESFNARLAAWLDTRHKGNAHPLDQSLRNGTQTSRELTSETDAEIRLFFAAVEQRVSEYCASLDADEHHPYLSRNTGNAAIRGSWSVRLSAGGFHVNHIHPQGWISSAYYVAVPDEVESAADRSGWLQFGAPRMPVPGLGPGHFVRPKSGRLVLFPSYMWHGTIPLQGPDPRLTIAFDAQPV